MKYVVVFVLLIGICFAQALVDKLENSYFKKAEKIEVQKQAAIKEVAVKYDNVSKRLAESYLKSLKAMLKSETQKGDFDSAIKIKAKIVEIENMLKAQTPLKVAKSTKPKITKPNVTKSLNGLRAYQGIWVHNSGDHTLMTYEIKGNEIWFISLYNKTHKLSDNYTKRSKLKYEQNGDEYTIAHMAPSGPQRHATYTINFKTGKSVFRNSNRKSEINCTIARKKAKLHLHWQGFKNNNHYILHLLDDSVCNFIVNGSKPAKGKWSVSNGVISVKWDNGASNTYKIGVEKITDNFGSVWTPIGIGDKLDGRVYRWSSTQRITFQADGKILKASSTGSFKKSASTWKEISPGVIQWSMYKFHFAADLSYYNIEKGGKKYDQKIPFLSVRDK